MSNPFASGKHAIAQCDRCDFRFKLKQLRKQVLKTKTYNLLVCPNCWDPDHPQLQLGMYPVSDPQALRDPRPDRSYVQSGNTGLRILPTTATTQDGVGFPAEGSRDFQWGWSPVGGARSDVAGLTVNYLVPTVQVGTVVVVTT